MTPILVDIAGSKTPRLLDLFRTVSVFLKVKRYQTNFFRTRFKMVTEAMLQAVN